MAETLKDGKDLRLDEWALKRHQVADVVSLTDRLTRMATMKAGVGRVFRNMGMKVAGTMPPVRNAIAFRLAELNTR